MPSTWKRIDLELTRRNKNWQWLADRLGWTIQRVQNWKLRGVPNKVFPEVATALGRSIDWVAGRGDVDSLLETGSRLSERTPADVERWPFKRVELRRVMDLPAPEFERIQGYIEATVAGWEASGEDRKSVRG